MHHYNFLQLVSLLRNYEIKELEQNDLQHQRPRMKNIDTHTDLADRIASLIEDDIVDELAYFNK